MNLLGNQDQVAGGVWVVDSGEEVDRLLPVLFSTKHPVGLDLEFTYVKKRHFLDHTRITCLTLGIIDGSLVGDKGRLLAQRVFVPAFDNDDLVQALKPWLESAEHPKTGHNLISADAHVLVNHGITLRGIEGDTLRTSRLSYNSKDIKHGLKDCLRREFGYKVVDLETVLQRPKRLKPKAYKKTSYRKAGKTSPLYGTGIKVLYGEGEVFPFSHTAREVIPQHEYWEHYPREPLVDYATLDAKGAAELLVPHRERLSKLPARGGNTWELWCNFWRPYCELIAATEVSGIALDSAACGAGAAAARFDIAAFDDQLAPYALGDAWNWNSPADLKQLFYHHWRMPRAPIKGTMRAIKPTKPGEFCATEASIHWLQLQCVGDPERHQVLDIIRRRKKAARLLGYLEKLPKFVHADGRIHPMVAPSTDTGRLAASNPPLQQIPGVKGDKYGIRRAFVAAPGKVLIVADYSQLEVYILAHYLIKLCKDDSLARALATGDVYGAIAKQCWPIALAGVGASEIKHHPDKAISGWRDKSKIVLLAKNYCMSPQGLAISLLDETGQSVGLEASMSLMSAIDSAYPSIPEFQRRMARLATTNGGIADIMGFWRPLPEAMSDHEGTRAAGHRKAANTPIQGSAAKIVALAMLILKAKYPWVLQLLQVHDEIVSEVDEARGDEAAAAVEECMVEAGERLGLLVRLKAEVKKALCWAEGK